MSHNVKNPLLCTLGNVEYLTYIVVKVIIVLKLREFVVNRDLVAVTGSYSYVKDREIDKAFRVFREM